MNRRMLVLGVSSIAVAGFAGGAVFVRNRQRSEREKAIAQTPAVAEDFLIRSYSPVLGSANAPVTLVEFFDPSCEACRAFHPLVKQLLNSHPNDLRVVLRYTTFHKGSDEAVRILETARMQQKFEPVLEALLKEQPRWAKHGQPNLDLAWQIAENAGLDLEKASSDRLFPGITAILNQDSQDVKAAGVRQTPTFFLNGKTVEIKSRESLSLAVKEAIGIAE